MSNNSKNKIVETKTGKNVFSDMDILLTVAEVASWLNFTERSVREWVRKKSIPYIRIGPGKGRIRFNKNEIEVWLKDGQSLFSSCEERR